MKKALLIILLVLLIGGSTLAAVFYKKFYPGLKPVINEPPEDIAELLDPINETEFPLTIPQNFKIEIFAKDLPQARVMIMDPAANMLVSQTKQGKISHLTIDETGKVTSQKTLIDRLNNPHGMAFLCENSGDCQLYIAEERQITRSDYNAQDGTLSNTEKISDLTTGKGTHYSRSIGFGADNRLYVSAGSSCNVCHEQDPLRATIFSMNPDGSDRAIYALGLRNAPFFTLHPVTGEMWATEMGRDLLGDNLPPDEINIVKENTFYGWPYYYGKDVRDEKFEPNSDVSLAYEMQGSHIDLPAHVAPLGLAFFPEEGWPEEYWHDLLVAYHGSWNSTTPVGYEIHHFDLDEEGNYIGDKSFITGWLLENGKALGRPVDIMIQPGGTIYISDDKAGVVYKMSYLTNPME